MKFLDVFYILGISFGVIGICLANHIPDFLAGSLMISGVIIILFPPILSSLHPKLDKRIFK